MTTQKSTDSGAVATMRKSEIAIGKGDGATDSGRTNAGTGATRAEIMNHIQVTGEEVAAALRNEVKIKKRRNTNTQYSNKKRASVKNRSGRQPPRLVTYMYLTRYFQGIVSNLLSCNIVCHPLPR